MTTQLNPDAAFDCLFIAGRLQVQTGTFTIPELHLACLLWLYRGRAVADWGYSFMGTELGAPFSVDLELAVTTLLDRGFLIRTLDGVCTSELAEPSVAEMGSLSLNKDRVECLDSSCASTAALSSGMVGCALAQEPDLRRAQATPMSRLLLEDAARSQLFLQFDALRNGLRSGDDLRTPAVVWLTALYRSSVSAV